MEQISVGCGILAAGLHLLAYATYIKQTRKGTSTPNILSWGIITGLMWLNATSYLNMSVDPVKSLQAFSGAVASSFLIVDTIRRGSFYWPNLREGLIVVIGTCSILVWRLYGSATYANLLAICALVIVFGSILAGVIRDPRIENPRAWIIWCTAFGFGVLTVILRYQGQPQDFAYPATGIAMDSLIVFFARKARKLRFQASESSQSTAP